MNIHLRATAALLCVAAACSAAPENACIVPDTTHSLPATLREASGAVFGSQGTLWVIADSGEPVLYAIGSDNSVEARVRIANARIQDWEDLARGPCESGECLYIGDIGDNLHAYPARTILQIPEPPTRDTVVTARRLRFKYPDGPADAEALLALPDGSLLVITKGRNRAVGVYRYPPPLRPEEVVTLEHVQDLTEGIVQLPRQATGASRLGADRILVRSYARIQLYRWEGDTLAAEAPPIDVTMAGERQGEGVAAGDDGMVVLVGERGSGGTIARLRCTWDALAGTDDAPM